MAQEERRGCGYRKVGGMYLVGSGMGTECDRLPLPVQPCPVCGAGVHFTRTMAKVNPYQLWGNHYPPNSSDDCSCETRCYVCYPPDDIAFIIGVGEKHYRPQQFIQEAITMGISKRIPAIPREMVIGKTPVYLCHKKAIEIRQGNREGKKPEFKMAIIYAFIPQKVEKLIWESEATKGKLKRLRLLGLTPVIIKDGDKDHA